MLSAIVIVVSIRTGDSAGQQNDLRSQDSTIDVAVSGESPL